MNYDKNLKKKYSVEDKARGINASYKHEIIDLNRSNSSKIKSGMFWYSDDTVSGELIPDKDLKSIVLFVKRGWVVGDTFEQQKLPWTKAMEYVEAFSNSFVNKGCAYKIPFDELLYVVDNIVDINNALAKLGMPLWDKRYWSATSYDVVELLKFNKPVAWAFAFKTRKSTQTDLNEVRYVRPVFRFKLED